MLSKQAFEEGLEFLGDTFGRYHGIYSNEKLKMVWLSFFRSWDDQKFFENVVYYCTYCESGFPKTPAVLKNFKTEEDSRNPGETYTQKLKGLPSVEEREVSNLSPEQIKLNLKRIAAITGIVAKLREMPKDDKIDLAKATTGANAEELDAVIHSCQSVKTFNHESRFTKVDGRIVIFKDVSDNELLDLLKHSDRSVQNAAQIQVAKRKIDIEF